MAKHFAATPNGLLGGHALNALPKNPYSTASQLLIDYIYGYYNAEPDRATFFASNNIALPREAFHKVGRFDTAFPLPAGEDRKLSDRWVFHGYPMQYVADAKIYHTHYFTLKTFWRQHFNYGRGAYHYHRIRAARTSDLYCLSLSQSFIAAATIIAMASWRRLALISLIKGRCQRLRS